MKNKKKDNDAIVFNLPSLIRKKIAEVVTNELEKGYEGYSIEYDSQGNYMKTSIFCQFHESELADEGHPSTLGISIEYIFG